jgi:uncharacterized protein (TIGR03435 family)
MKRVVVVTWLALLLGVASHPAAQSAAKPRFEVASVKPSAADPVGKPTFVPPAPGRFTMLNVPLRTLVLMAYGELFDDYTIVGGPDWLNSRRFDVQAKAEDAGASRDAMVPMVKTLLEERFKLKVHTETREMPIFALILARDDRRLGANITPSTTDCSKPGPVSGADAMALLKAGRGVPCAIMPAPTTVAGSMTLRANGASMAALARFLGGTTRRVVNDRTGLSGLYDWEMTYDRSVMSPTAQPSESPVLTTALQEQLGLKLESTRGPVEVLVIDSAELPDPD